MSKIYLHADWHFNHEFVAGTRGFSSSEEHDERLLEDINATVTKRDVLWVLGDVFMGSISAGLEKVARINGTKRLVLGNHDAAHPMHQRSAAQTRRFLEVFDSVHLHEELRLPGARKVLLSHFPYDGDHGDREDRHRQWRLRDEGSWLVHGHVHDEWVRRGRQLNVGVDIFARPRSAEEILETIVDLEDRGIV